MSNAQLELWAFCVLQDNSNLKDLLLKYKPEESDVNYNDINVNIKIHQ